jgi:hypothetical protein
MMAATITMIVATAVPIPRVDRSCFNILKPDISDSSPNEYSLNLFQQLSQDRRQPGVKTLFSVPDSIRADEEHPVPDEFRPHRLGDR